MECKIFSTMDLIPRYWQVELPPSEQEKYAIVTLKDSIKQLVCKRIMQCLATFLRKTRYSFLLS